MVFRGLIPIGYRVLLLLAVTGSGPAMASSGQSGDGGYSLCRQLMTSGLFFDSKTEMTWVKVRDLRNGSTGIDFAGPVDLHLFASAFKSQMHQWVDTFQKNNRALFTEFFDRPATLRLTIRQGTAVKSSEDQREYFAAIEIIGFKEGKLRRLVAKGADSLNGFMLSDLAVNYISALGSMTGPWVKERAFQPYEIEVSRVVERLDEGVFVQRNIHHATDRLLKVVFDAQVDLASPTLKSSRVVEFVHGDNSAPVFLDEVTLNKIDKHAGYEALIKDHKSQTRFETFKQRYQEGVEKRINDLRSKIAAVQTQQEIEETGVVWGDYERPLPRRVDHERRLKSAEETLTKLRELLKAAEWDRQFLDTKGFEPLSSGFN